MRLYEIYGSRRPLRHADGAFGCGRRTCGAIPVRYRLNGPKSFRVTCSFMHSVRCGSNRTGSFEAHYAGALEHFNRQLDENKDQIVRCKTKRMRARPSGAENAVRSCRSRARRPFPVTPKIRACLRAGRAHDRTGVERAECADRKLHDRRRSDGAGQRICAPGAEAWHDPRRQPYLGESVLGSLRHHRKSRLWRAIPIRAPSASMSAISPTSSSKRCARRAVRRG